MDEYLTTQEFADQEGVSRRTVQRWISDGLIFAVKIGREYRIPFDEKPPDFYRRADLTNSDVPPPPNLIPPADGGFPFDHTKFEPEDIDDAEDFDEEVEEEEDDCKDPNDFDPADLRKVFATREEAEDYAGDIPVTTEVFRRCSDRFFQVAVNY